MQVRRFDDVGVAIARDEGEGYASIDDWRRAHIAFWESEAMRSALGQPHFRVTGETLVVTERFRLVEVLGGR